MFSQTLLTPYGHMKITKNPALVLRRFRYHDGERYLWADAVSINQADLDEKGIQVAMMGDVYRKALRVLAWLSQGDKESAQAMSSIEGIAKASDTYGTQILSDIIIQGAQGKGITQEIEAAYWNLERSTLLDPLRSIYNREWFNRLWVVQEGVLAQEIPMFYGSSEVTFADFEQTTTVLFKMYIMNINSWKIFMRDIAEALRLRLVRSFGWANGQILTDNF